MLQFGIYVGIYVINSGERAGDGGVANVVFHR